MAWTITEIAVWSVLAVALLAWATWLSAHWFFVERYPDEIRFARTDDGWRIAILRYRPERPNGADPVLLCHGLASNHLNFDLSDELSLPRYLASAGYDTFVVELRGRGMSTRPRPFSRYRYDWSFDEYVERDVPVALEAVRQVTGREGVHLVGYSEGGMIAYALLGRPEHAQRVRSAVAIGAPATFRFQRKYLFSWPLRNLRWVRHRLLARLLAPLAGYKYMPSVRILYEKSNVSGQVLRRYIVNATANLGRDEMLQLGDWIENDAFRSIDQRRDYRAQMARITTPILFVGGNKDRLAPPPAVKDAYDAVGAAAHRELVIASRGKSFLANYGHLDLMLGREAAREIYPLVRQWLDARSGLGDVAENAARSDSG